MPTEIHQRLQPLETTGATPYYLSQEIYERPVKSAAKVWVKVWVGKCGLESVGRMRNRYGQVNEQDD